MGAQVTHSTPLGPQNALITVSSASWKSSADRGRSSPTGFALYSAAMKEVGNADRQGVGGRLNNRAKNSHQPFRRRERAMLRFRVWRRCSSSAQVHGQVHNHFNQERDLVTRSVYKQRRSAALAEWRALAAW